LFKFISKADYIQRIHHVLLRVILSLDHPPWKKCFITSLFCPE